MRFNVHCEDRTETCDDNWTHREHRVCPYHNEFIRCQDTPFCGRHLMYFTSDPPCFSLEDLRGIGDSEIFWAHSAFHVGAWGRFLRSCIYYILQSNFLGPGTRRLEGLYRGSSDYWPSRQIEWQYDDPIWGTVDGSPHSQQWPRNTQGWPAIIRGYRETNLEFHRTIGVTLRSFTYALQQHLPRHPFQYRRFMVVSTPPREDSDSDVASTNAREASNRVQEA
ncbi:hypothetical protein F5Y18DRAFT_243733 [Xylariaceae sp. FL1019]|nr:hypothetical protein F5Y18DRAFT_243733 [Xylariaceae sp. FL1019]